MKVAIIIPSRIDSTRLPRKALAQINGQTLIERAWRCAVNAKMGDVFVATDSEEIASVVKKAGGEVIITPKLPTGTDRIWCAYQKIEKEYDVVVNLQGDVPNIHKKIVSLVLETLQKTGADISTATMKITEELAKKPSCVKPVLTKRGEFYKALYFSRAMVPHEGEYFEHIGIYAYHVEALRKFTSLPESPLEKVEKLEQLRALENDMSIFVCVVDSSLKPINIDTEEDLTHARNVLQKQEFDSTSKFKALAESLKKNLLRRKG